METNDVKKVVESSFNFYEQISDKIVNDAINKGLGTEEILGAVTLMFLDIAICAKLSADGVTDYKSQYAKNKREELSSKLRNLLDDFFLDNNNNVKNI